MGSSSFAANRQRVAALRRGQEAGFTIVELTITMVIMAIVSAITFGLFVGIEQQSVNVNASINGARQAQLAGTSLIQYLRTAVQIAGNPPLSGTPPTTLTPAVAANAMPGSIGVVSDVGNSGGATPNLTPIYATFTAGTGHLPTGTGTLAVTIGFGSSTRTVKTFNVLSPSAGHPLFTYYVYTSPPFTAPPNTTNLQGDIEPLSSGFSASCLPLIVAIGVNVSFFAGPEDTPTRGYAADVATTVSTIIYLHNSVSYGSPTTTTLPTETGCT